MMIRQGIGISTDMHMAGCGLSGGVEKLRKYFFPELYSDWIVVHILCSSAACMHLSCGRETDTYNHHYRILGYIQFEQSKWCDVVVGGCGIWRGEN